MSQARPTLMKKCEACGRACFLRRLRGPWRGLVQVCNGADATPEGRQPVVQLPQQDGVYTLAGFRCPKCK